MGKPGFLNARAKQAATSSAKGKRKIGAAEVDAAGAKRLHIQDLESPTPGADATETVGAPQQAIHVESPVDLVDSLSDPEVEATDPSPAAEPSSIPPPKFAQAWEEEIPRELQSALLPPRTFRKARLLTPTEKTEFGEIQRNALKSMGLVLAYPALQEKLFHAVEARLAEKRGREEAEKARAEAERERDGAKLERMTMEGERFLAMREAASLRDKVAQLEADLEKARADSAAVLKSLEDTRAAAQADKDESLAKEAELTAILEKTGLEQFENAVAQIRHFYPELVFDETKLDWEAWIEDGEFRKDEAGGDASSGDEERTESGSPDAPPA